MVRTVLKHVKKDQEAARARGFAEVCLWPDDPDPPPPSVFSKKFFTKKRKQVGAVLHSVPVQAVVTVLILVDFFFAILLEVRDKEDSQTEKLVSLIIIILLCIEVLVRMFVEGWHFWKRKTNVIESLVIFAGFVIAIAGSELPVSAGRVIRPIARMFRGGRVAMKVWTRSTQIKRSANQVMARKAEMLFWNFFTDLVLVRPENIVFSPMTGKFDFAKARLNTQVLEELHIPVTVKGGFVEGVHCEMPVAAVAGRAALDEGDSGRFLRIELINLVIVVSNGPDTDWNDQEKLKEKKSRLVNHLTARLVPNALPVVEVEGEDDPQQASSNASFSLANFSLRHMLELSRMLEPVRRWIRQYLAVIQNYVRKTIQSKMMSGIDIKVKNIMIQYEEQQDRDLAPPRWLFGLKIGKISVSTAVSQPIKVDLWKTLDAEDDQEHCEVTNVFGSFSKTVKSELIKHLMINIDRVSMFCTLRPSVDACFSKEFKECNMQAAVKKAKRKELMERVRLALAKPWQERRGGFSPCDKAGEPLLSIHQEHDYVMLPMSVEVANTLPRFAQADDTVVTHQNALNRIMKLETTPVSFVLDNTQAFSINSWTDKMISWFREEWLLQLRPEQRIETVLHLKDEKDWHSQFVRRTVVRQWWLHAFVLVQESTGARSRHVACFVELQVRSRRRLEYIELVAHLMRCKAHSKTVRGRLRRMMDGMSGQTPIPHSEDDEYSERVRALQLRMSLQDVLRSHFEARFVAGKRETAVAQTRRGLCQKLADCLSALKTDELPEKHRISVHRGETPFEMRVDEIDDNLQQLEASASMDDLGVTLAECSPTNILFIVPAVEFCFMLVSSWDRVVFRRGNVQAAEFQLQGTRRKLMHVWVCGIDVSVTQCKLVLGADYPILLPKNIEASLTDVGARYHEVQTGRHTEALKCGMCKDGNKADGTPTFWHVFGERLGGSDENGKEYSNHWEMKMHVGHIETLIDTVKLVRVCVLVGESTLGLVVTRFVRWLLADPSWSHEGLGIYCFRLMQKIGGDGHSNAELSEESEGKRTLHILKRLFELCMGLAFIVKFSFSCDMTLSGMHHTMLQPEWSEIDWARWLQLQGHSPTGTWHYPADKPTRTVQADYELPKVRLRWSRTMIPPMMLLELPQIGECRSQDQTGDADKLPSVALRVSQMQLGLSQQPSRHEVPLSNIVIRPHTLHPEARGRIRRWFSM